MTEQKRSIPWVLIVTIIFIVASCGLAVVSRQLQDDLSVLGINSLGVSDYLTVLSVHFTTVFLTTALMSTLGTEGKMIYHRDIAEMVLVEPPGRNFRDLSVYAFETLAVAVAAFVYRSAYVVLFSALAGTVVIAWIFFKMIGIYFGEASWRRKIIREIKRPESNIDEYRENLQQLYSVLEKNLKEPDVEALAWNLSLLIELQAYYEYDAEQSAHDRGSAAKDILDILVERIGEQTQTSVLELYARILSIFTDKKKYCCMLDRKLGCTEDKLPYRMAILNSFFMDYAASHDDLASDRRKNAVIQNVFGFGGESQGVREWIESLKDQVKTLKEEDYKARDDGYRESRFVELAEKVCKSQLLATFYHMSVCDDTDAELLYRLCAGMEDLVGRDERRIEKTLGEKLSSFDFPYPNGIRSDENSVCRAWEYTMERDMNEALFIQRFPYYAVRYGGRRIGELLREFFFAYCGYVRGIEWAMYGEGRREFRYYGISSQDSDVYETMCICYLQGCAEQIMKGVPGIADIVAGLVVNFWQDVQSYKPSAELTEFYRDSFGHIGNSLLYADDSMARKNYNERPEGMLQFMESLIRKIRICEMPYVDEEDETDMRPIDKERVFGGFVKTLQELSPRFYSEDTVAKVERLIRQPGYPANGWR